MKQCSCFKTSSKCTSFELRSIFLSSPLSFSGCPELLNTQSKLLSADQGGNAKTGILVLICNGVFLCVKKNKNGLV